MFTVSSMVKIFQKIQNNKIECYNIKERHQKISLLMAFLFCLLKKINVKIITWNNLVSMIHVQKNIKRDGTASAIPSLKVMPFSYRLFLPVIKLKTKMITAMTSKTWISPPATTSNTIPKTHNTTKIPIIVHNILHHSLSFLSKRVPKAEIKP